MTIGTLIVYKTHTVPLTLVNKSVKLSSPRPNPEWICTLFAATFLAAFCATPNAHATVTPLGQFQGYYSENFESFTPGLFTDGSPILGGTATLFGANDDSTVIYTQSNPNQFNLGGSNAKVNDGTKGFGVTFGAPAVVFATPVLTFGGFFGGYNNPSANIHVTFLDNNGNLIDLVDVPYSNATGTLEWHGWLSDTGIKTIIFHGEGPNDEFVMDSLEAIAVPEVSHWVVGLAMLGISSMVVRKEIRQRKLATIPLPHSDV